MDPTRVFEACMQHMNDNHLNANNHNVPQRQIWDKLLERLRALHPEKFDGMTELWKFE